MNLLKKSLLALTLGATIGSSVGYKYADHLVGDDAAYIGWSAKQKLRDYSLAFLLNKKDQISHHHYTKAEKAAQEIPALLETMVTNAKPLLATCGGTGGGILGTMIFLGIAATGKRRQPA